MHNFQSQNPENLKENEPPDAQNLDPVNENRKDTKTVFSDNLETLPKHGKNITETPINVCIPGEKESDASQHHDHHIYIEYDDDRPIVRSTITDEDIDTMFNPDDSLNKSINFDDRLFSDIVHLPRKPRPTHIIRRSRTQKHFRCQFEGCEKLFLDKVYLKYHYLTHFGIRPYKCNETNCHSRFISKHQRQMHVQTHYHFKGFKCPFCDIVTETLEDMNEHIVIHQEEI
ncbi:Zinc finger protein 76 [Thelohanellus kitauei]|uniref:Zinc finger protein 76 n=1 Tax=Thelohanellus kitauei TaxID=669202 RepID=A0A0C2JX98_THEKT|nr:Zinc finger protein 76 [Thelohanellus kitauei]